MNKLEADHANKFQTYNDIQHLLAWQTTAPPPHLRPPWSSCSPPLATSGNGPISIQDWIIQTQGGDVNLVSYLNEYARRILTIYSKVDNVL